MVAPVQDVMQKYSLSWSAEAWAEAYTRALAYVFELPHARTVEPAEAQDMVCGSASQGRLQACFSGHSVEKCHVHTLPQVCTAQQSYNSLCDQQ